MPPDRIALGYNAVDNALLSPPRPSVWRDERDRPRGLAGGALFLDGMPIRSREKPGSADPRRSRGIVLNPTRCTAWDLVLCGDGPRPADVEDAIARSGCASAIHRPGFLQADALTQWYAHAEAFVLPSLSEPWGLVVNEAAASGLPLLVSARAGCAATLVPEPEGTTGGQFDPLDLEEMTTKLAWMAGLSQEDRRAMGQRAARGRC